jgi:glycine dehydrogenase subunit 2
MNMPEPTIFELSSPGRTGITFPKADVPETALPEAFIRHNLPLPELSELDAVRHFNRLARKNYSIDTGFYPLGSCTMKYNPKINEAVSRLPGFLHTHPLQPIETVQGNLFLIYLLQQYLAEITGFDAVSLQPAAGAQGEFVGVKMIKHYLRDQGQDHRNVLLIPDSAHGTNPASATMNGFIAIPVPSNAQGTIDLDALSVLCQRDDIAGIMITNPNTLGLFEKDICKVTEMIHAAGGLVYGDGANMNAILGMAKPANFGIDVLHLNLHKTFSTPHGGGGPGSGPVCTTNKLASYLPSPLIAVLEEGTDELPPLYGFINPDNSIGRVKTFQGQFNVLVKAFTYIQMLGADGLKQVAQYAVLNANYLLSKLREYYPVPYDRLCKHEFVVEGAWKHIPDIHALDIAKRLMDYGFHPPTNYFPLIVHEALMIEPTETESKQALDQFADALISIAQEAEKQPDLLRSAPHNTPIGRLDELKAAKQLNVCCSLDFFEDA